MKILGLDLGVASIGWALIEIDDDLRPLEILGIGSRIVPLAQKEAPNFSAGKGESKNAVRTLARTMRKGYSRFEMRRDHLQKYLRQFGMYDPSSPMLNLAPLELWGLRAKAATDGEVLTPLELGRVLLHINQKRGYKHAKSSGDSESKDTDYVAAINERYADLIKEGMTLGQKMYDKMLASAITTTKGKTVVTARIKEGDKTAGSNLLPRQAHIDEFDRIMEVQSKSHPELLTPETVAKLRSIIFFQRPLKSCKHLVSNCEFISYEVQDKDGKNRVVGPKVAPVTSPISQVTRIWETVNNLKLINRTNKPATGKKKKGYADQTSLFDESEAVISKEWRLLQREYILNDEERHIIFNWLNKNEKITASKILDLLGIKRSEGFVPNIGTTSAGIKGNMTYVAIAKALEGYPQHEHLLEFNLQVVDRVDEKTGEVLREISPSCYDQSLYRLWHLLYSVSEKNDVSKALETQFGITEPELIERLYAIDFTTPGFSNRSAKFMRWILPYLMDGMMYSEACEKVGVRHSGYMTSDENAGRALSDRLPLIPKGYLRQPTVEKVLNQMVNIVNSLIEKFGPIDEIRVELARELKQSKEERASATVAINKREKENDLAGRIIEEYGLRPSRNRIQKYRLWKEAGGRCVYCGKTIGARDFLVGDDSEVEHIVPRSLLFDDSLTNKALSCRECNGEKGQRTAFDYMSAKTQSEFDEYLSRVKCMAENAETSYRISKTKYNRFLMPEGEIPQDFLARDLRATQYISRKALEMLTLVCRNVYASSGKITDFLRHVWGYDTILHSLNLERYKNAGLVSEQTFEHRGQLHTELRIDDWSKRLDHRHHAVDALTVALTRQGYVQRLNNLNQEREHLKGDIESQGREFKERHSLLQQWTESRPHFSVREVAEAVDGIAVSFKSGKKVTTTGRKHKRRNGTEFRPLVPRGELHESTIYGRRFISAGEKPLKYCLQHPDLIADPKVRDEVNGLLTRFDGDLKKIQSWLKKNPLCRDASGEPVVKFECSEPKMTIRYSIAQINSKNVETVIDPDLRETIRQRLSEVSDKGFEKSLAERPILQPGGDIRVKRVKCYAKLAPESTVAVRKVEGRPVGYAKTGSNHHVAFYERPDGKTESVVTTLWMAVKRKEVGLPAIIRNPEEAWTMLMNLPDSEVVGMVAAELPDQGWKFLRSMQVNEMFVLGLSDDEWEDALRSKDFKTLSAHLYRVQTMTAGDYRFRFHKDIASNFDKQQYALNHGVICASLNAYNALNPRKVKVNAIGEIIPIDD